MHINCTAELSTSPAAACSKQQRQPISRCLAELFIKYMEKTIPLLENMHGSLQVQPCFSSDIDCIWRISSEKAADSSTPLGKFSLVPQSQSNINPKTFRETAENAALKQVMTVHACCQRHLAGCR
jgi:hypothetical protein